jgi:cytochrome c553
MRDRHPGAGSIRIESTLLGLVFKPNDLVRPGGLHSAGSCSRAAVLAAALLIAAPALAADARAGRAKAIGCQACHGMDGLSKHPEAPHLAGQIENYLVKAMRDYRSGERKNEMMTIVAKDLTDDEIANLAAFYAAIQIEVVPP